MCVYIRARWYEGTLLLTLLADPQVGHDLQQIMSDLQQAPYKSGNNPAMGIAGLAGDLLDTVVADFLMGDARRYGYRDVFGDGSQHSCARSWKPHGGVVVLYWCGEGNGGPAWLGCGHG